MDGQATVGVEDVQVAAKRRRRTYTAEYERRSLKEADACTTPGAVGALLRRDGLYSSHLVVWRRARGWGELAVLTPKKRGRKPTSMDGRDLKSLPENGTPLGRMAAHPNPGREIPA